MFKGESDDGHFGAVFFPKMSFSNGETISVRKEKKKNENASTYQGRDVSIKRDTIVAVVRNCSPC